MWNKTKLIILAVIMVLIPLLGSGQPALAAAAPSGLTATVASATRVDLAWTDNSADETGFRVERSADGTTFATAGTVAVNVAAFSDTTVTAGNTFFYRVVSTSAAGDSAPSNVVSVKVAAPGAPSDLSATIMSASRVDVTWTDQSGNESGFRIERSLDNFATAPSATFAVARNLRTFSDTTVAVNNTYSYRIIAVNGAGNSAPTSSATVTVTAKLQVGPVDPAFIFQGNPNTSFPGYYQDDQGTRVALLPITGNGATAPTQIFEPVDPANPYSVFLGMGEEAFYWIATVDFATRLGRAHARFAVEANVATPGGEVVFTRIRLKALVPTPGTYTFTHPFGTDVFEVTSDDIAARGGIFFTEDIGLAERDFTQATTGRITRFLRQTVPTPPPGWIGDGVSAGPVTGSPTGFNKVRLTGPAGVNLDGAGNNFVESNQFSVAARLQTMAAPIPDFSKSLAPPTGVAPVTVTFTDTSTGAPTKWSWSFGDGTTSALKNPTKTYNAAGTYTVKLTVTNAAGTATTSQIVTVYSAPVAGFTKTAPNGIPPVTINFTDTSSGTPSIWLWAFGDGATSSLQNPSKTYATAGAFTITLTVTNVAGSSSTSQTLSISPNLIASFTRSLAPASGVAPVTVTFTDTSTGAITGWLWNFGDGTTSALQNPPPKTYATAGNFTVTLTVTDAQGTAATSQVVSVFGTLSASFTKDPTFGRPPLTVNFTDTSTGNPTAWSWAFGDGTTSNLQNPTKVYSVFATYTVTLTVTNAAGSASTSGTVIVTGVDPTTLKLQPGPLEPAFIFQGNPNTSFPQYYQDDQGTRVALLPITGDGINAPTQIFEPVDPADPYSVFLGTGEEAFYHIATVDFATRAGRAHARFAVEANFAGPGGEVVFTRIRLKAQVPTPGTYTFTHPFGTDVFEVTADDIAARGGIFFTEDIGLAERDFLVAGTGRISRFLRQTVPPPPAGWLGDGASVGPVTGSPTGFNKVRLTGPSGVNLDGAGNNFVESNQFSVASRLVTAVVPATVPPTAPTALTATAASATQVNLSWTDNATTEANYRIERSVNAFTTAPSAIFMAAANATIFFDTSAPSGTSVSYRVIAVNAAGDSTPSNVVQITTPALPGATPPSPTGLTAIASGAQVNLGWTDNATIETGFRIDRATDATFSAGLLVRAVPANTVAFRDTAVTPGATYFYRIVAVNAAGASAPSNVVSVTVSAAAILPAPPPVGSSGPGGGGGGAPPTTPGTVAIVGLSPSAPVTLDNSGKAATNATLKDGSGKVTINVAAGTVALDSNKQPLTTITANPAVLPPTRPRARAVVLAINLGPSGAQFNPPLELAIKYDVNTLPPGVREKDLIIAFWDGAKWISLGGKVDTQARTVTAKVSHFSEFALMAGEDTPTPTPLPAAPMKPAAPAKSPPPAAPVVQPVATPTPPLPATAPTVRPATTPEMPPAMPPPAMGAPEVATPGPAIIEVPPAVAEPAQVIPAPQAPTGANWPLILSLIAAMMVAAFIFYRIFLRVPEEQE